jgi:hypothetical protein
VAGSKCASNWTSNFKSKLPQNVFTVLRQYIKGLLISILNWMSKYLYQKGIWMRAMENKGNFFLTIDLQIFWYHHFRHEVSHQNLHVCGKINFLLSHSICIPPQGNSNYVHYILCRSLTAHFVYTVILKILFFTASRETSNIVEILMLITTTRNTWFNSEIEFLNIIYTRGFP